MTAVASLLDEFTKLSIDRLNAAIALGAIGLAAFAIYAVLVVIREQRRK
jgi:hypothetical protein